jgi:hypothetical protein
MREKLRLQIVRSLPDPFKLAEHDTLSRPVSNLIPPIGAVCLIIAQMLPSFICRDKG